MSKPIATNPKAFFDYQILEKFEAGLVLTGQEIKAIRKGKISLKRRIIGHFVSFLLLMLQFQEPEVSEIFKNISQLY